MKKLVVAIMMLAFGGSLFAQSDKSWVGGLLLRGGQRGLVLHTPVDGLAEQGRVVECGVLRPQLPCSDCRGKHYHTMLYHKLLLNYRDLDNS